MILLAMGIIYFDGKSLTGNEGVKLNKPEWFFLILGSGILIIGFAWDYSVYMLEQFRFLDLFSFSGKAEVLSRSLAYIPRSFNWLIYIVAQLIILLGIVMFYLRNFKIVKK
jgi:hypothetical protein